MVVMQLQKSNNVLKYYTIPNNLYLLSVKYLNSSWTLSVKKKKLDKTNWWTKYSSARVARYCWKKNVVCMRVFVCFHVTVATILFLFLLSGCHMAVSAPRARMNANKLTLRQVRCEKKDVTLLT